MRGAYVLGAVDALFSHYGLKQVDVVTGTSGSVGTLAYYAAGQFYPGYYIWTEEIPRADFLSFLNPLRGKPVMDIDYLIDESFKKKIPITVSNLKSSKTKLVASVVSRKTGTVNYIDAHTCPHDLFEVLRATMAAPIVYNKTVRLGSDDYFDSFFSDPIPLDNPFVQDTRKIIILSKPLEFSPNVRGHKLAFMFKPFLTEVAYAAMLKRDQVRQVRVEECKRLAAQGDIVIAPATMPTQTLDNRRASIERLIAQGYRDAVAHPQLQKLTQELRQSSQKDFLFPEPAAAVPL